MTRPKAPGPARVPPFVAAPGAAVVPMVVPVVVPVVVTVPVIVAVFWITGQARGGLAALLGVVVAMAFFASGLYIMSRVVKADPLLVLAGALAVYFGQVIFLGVVIFFFSGADWLDGTSFGLSVLAIALIWQASQVVAFLKVRQLLYDDPVDHPSEHANDERVAGPNQERLS